MSFQGVLPIDIFWKFLRCSAGREAAFRRDVLFKGDQGGWGRHGNGECKMENGGSALILTGGRIFSILNSQFSISPFYGWGVIAMMVMIEIRPLPSCASGP